MRLLHLLVAVVLVAVVHGHAMAQGTSNQVPEPISTSDLRAYMRRYVQPAEQQWEALESLHDDYRAAFKQLREGDIEQLLKSAQAMESRGMPDREQLRKYLREHERVVAKIAEVDNALFDGIIVVLGDEKRPAVERVRNARVRDRELAGAISGSMFMGGAPDLSKISIDALQVDEATVAALTPDLVNYELRLTTLARALGEESRNMWLNLLDVLVEGGLGNMSEEDMADPAKMQEFMTAMQAAMQKVSEKVQKRTGEIRDLNARTFKSLVDRLQGDNARRLRHAYLASAHPMIGLSTTTERVFRTALKSSKLTDEIRASVQAEFDSFLRGDDAIVDQLVKVSEKIQGSFSMLDYSGEAAQSAMADLQKLQTERAARAETAMKNLTSIVGEDRYQKIYERVTAASTAADPLADGGDVDASQANSDGVEVSGGNVEFAAPAYAAGATPIGASDVLGLVGLLELSAEEKSTLEALHADYLKSWTEKVQSGIDTMQQSVANLWTANADGVYQLNIDAMNAQTAAQIAVLKAAAEVDDAFFADAAHVLGEARQTEIAVARVTRAAEVTDGDPMNYWGGYYGNGATAVNLGRLLNDSKIAPTSRAVARDVLATQADEYVKAAREGALARIEVQRESQVLSAKWQEESRNGGDSGAAASFGAQMAANQSKASAIGETRRARDEALLEAMVSALSDDDASVLRIAFERTAYPAVFADPRSAVPFMDAAAAMTDLTDAQRQEFDALRAAYEKEYVDYCRKMIVKPRAAPTPEAWRENYLEYARQENERAKVRFDRDERSARAVSQLRRILTAEQVARIPGLDRYELEQSSERRGFYP